MSERGIERARQLGHAGGIMIGCGFIALAFALVVAVLAGVGRFLWWIASGS